MKKSFIMSFVAIAILFLTTNCSNKEEQKEVKIDSVKQEVSEIGFKELSFDKATMPQQIKNYKGAIELGKHWTDKNGDNFFILTFEQRTYKENTDEGGSSSLLGHGYHFCNNNSPNYNLVREFNDFVTDCEWDLVYNYLNEYFTVQDLNNNQFGEVTVIYELNCTSDVSPSTLKLLMFENGEKYAIRGTTKVDIGDRSKIGGEMKIDATFNKAENILKEYAVTQFQRAAGIK